MLKTNHSTPQITFYRSVVFTLLKLWTGPNFIFFFPCRHHLYIFLSRITNSKRRIKTWGSMHRAMETYWLCS